LAETRTAGEANCTSEIRIPAGRFTRRTPFKSKKCGFLTGALQIENKNFQIFARGSNGPAD
jgi:hypothetical protein